MNRKSFQYDARQTAAWLNLRTSIWTDGAEDSTDNCLDAPDWLVAGSTMAGEFNPILERCVHRESL